MLKKTDDEVAEVAEPEPAPAAAEVRTAEAWAEAKGLAPEFLPGPKQPDAPAGAAPPLDHNPKFARFAAAKHFHGWPQGKELTEAEFDAALKAESENVYR